MARIRPYDILSAVVFCAILMQGFVGTARAETLEETTSAYFAYREFQVVLNQIVTSIGALAYQLILASTAIISVLFILLRRNGLGRVIRSWSFREIVEAFVEHARKKTMDMVFNLVLIVLLLAALGVGRVVNFLWNVLALF